MRPSRQQAQLWVVSQPAAASGAEGTILPALTQTQRHNYTAGEEALHIPWVLLQSWGAPSWDPSIQQQQKLWMPLPWERSGPG